MIRHEVVVYGGEEGAERQQEAIRRSLPHQSPHTTPAPQSKVIKSPSLVVECVMLLLLLTRSPLYQEEKRCPLPPVQRFDQIIQESEIKWKLNPSALHVLFFAESSGSGQ